MSNDKTHQAGLTSHRFNPDRWLDPSRSMVDAFTPFGAGSRSEYTRSQLTYLFPCSNMMLMGLYSLSRDPHGDNGATTNNLHIRVGVSRSKAGT